MKWKGRGCIYPALLAVCGGEARFQAGRRSALSATGAQALGGFDHAEHVDHAGDVAEVAEVDQVDHAPNRPVREREHVASLDRWWCMSDPEIAAVGHLQSELDTYLHAASMPATPREGSDPIVSYLVRSAHPTFV